MGKGIKVRKLKITSNWFLPRTDGNFYKWGQEGEGKLQNLEKRE